MVVPVSTEPTKAEMVSTLSLKMQHSIAFDLIENRQWNQLIERIQTHPTDAALVAMEGVQSAQGNLAIHEACKNQPPLKVIEVLLKANPEGIKTKGRWGYTPLHYACSSGASSDVVSRLIKAYPTSTRMRDDSNEFLPIHLAAKWGAAEDVIMSILTTYPEGYFLKDALGKTPMDHAKALPMPIRASVVRALEYAPLLCAVSKSALERLEHENECRIRGMSDAHCAHVAKLQKRHEQELSKAAEIEERLRKDVTLIRSALDPLAEKLRHSEKRAIDVTNEKDEIIRNLESQLKKLQTRFESQGTELNALLAAAEDKIELLESQHADKSRQTDSFAVLVSDLTSKIDVHKRSEESLATRAVNLERSKLETERERDEFAKECERLREKENELSESLQEALHKNQLYVERLEKIQKWASIFAYSTQTWTIDNDWTHHTSKEEKILDNMAQEEGITSSSDADDQLDDENHADAEKCWPSSDTDESTIESNNNHRGHSDDADVDNDDEVDNDDQDDKPENLDEALDSEIPITADNLPKIDDELPAVV